MLTAEGCRQRRVALWKKLDPPPESDYLLLCDPIHLMYLANFWVDPISSSAGFPGFLMVRKDGHAKLLHDNHHPRSVEAAQVEERRSVVWYDGRNPGNGPRQLAILESVNPSRSGLRVHDRPGDPYAAIIIHTLAQMRRQKYPDEIALLRRCMRATDAGHAWARANVKPGMTELAVYAGISGACTQAAGMPVIVYGDFAVCPGPERTGGPPSDRVIQAGDMMILDFSVVIAGYRSDFTNTLVVGKKPTPDQQRLYDFCMQAMTAGEQQLHPGASCRAVYQAVAGAFDKAGMGQYNGHHAGHGLGLTHPEAPFFVPNANETLLDGDVVTLEPGLYVGGVGGMRIERNYHITGKGYETLSNHAISLEGAPAAAR